MNIAGNHTKLPIWAMGLLTILFCVFTLSYEKYASQRAQEKLDQHARIIADDLWNFNFNGAIEYLKLAAESNHYEKLAVISHNGELFQEISTSFPTPLESVLIRIHLTPRVILVSQIIYNDNIIGWVEAVWIPETLYTHLFVFIFFQMILLGILLYGRIVGEKVKLEHMVNERTNELTRSNSILKKQIEERIHAEEALRKSEEKYRFLAENIEDVIWTLNTDFQYSYVSPVAAKMYGWNPDELTGSDMGKILTPASLAVLQQFLATNKVSVKPAWPPRKTRPGRTIKIPTAEKKPFTAEPSDKKDFIPPQPAILELEMMHKNGSTIWCEVTISFLSDKTSGFTGTMWVARDITERRIAQQEREELQEKLERSKKMESLGLLAGGVAHDLNNVLSGIVSYPDLILLDIDQDSPLREGIETIRDSGIKAAEIVNDLLTLTRRGVFSTQILNLNNLVEEYLSSPEYRKMISYHPEIEVTLALEKDLPNIKGSPTPLKKVIMNLVSNAAEAQVKGGEIILRTSSRYLDKTLEGYQSIAEGEYAVLSVIDKGEGIDSEDLRRIFEPFYTKKVMGRSGTGLGLTVVWGTIEDHRGYIDIISDKSSGTTIDVYIPICRDNIEEAGDPEEANNFRGNGEKILIVDDIDYQRKIGCAILKRLNYTVISAASGEEAVAYLEENTVDLVMLDMIMDNGMDGLETYENILKRNPGQKAIIASGFSETERVKKAQRLGAGSYIKKPYKLEQLGKIISQELKDTGKPGNNDVTE
jgi:PAS domain S-box-containing protein